MVIKLLLTIPFGYSKFESSVIQQKHSTKEKKSNATKAILIAIIVFLIYPWLKQISHKSKDKTDKIELFGLTLAIIGLIIVLISSFF